MNFTLTEGNLTGSGVYLDMFTTVVGNMVVILFGITICFLNALMVHTFYKHEIFRFNPRYILFIHLVLNDIINLTASIFLYIFGHAFQNIYTSLCMLFLLLAILTTLNTPVNLACMATECYISVCIPLRYENICTVKKTYIVITVMWAIGLLTVLPDIFMLLVTEELHFFSRRVFCDRDSVFTSSYSKNKRDVSHIIFLVVVFLTLLYTYFRIMFVAKAANSDAKKARNTILLHGFQMLLCMTQYVHPLLKQVITKVFLEQKKYLLIITFVLIQVFPRFLNPVVYGLRDKAFRMYFKRYFIHLQVKAVKIQP